MEPALLSSQDEVIPLRRCLRDTWSSRSRAEPRRCAGAWPSRCNPGGRHGSAGQRHHPRVQLFCTQSHLQVPMGCAEGAAGLYEEKRILHRSECRILRQRGNTQHKGLLCQNRKFRTWPMYEWYKGDVRNISGNYFVLTQPLFLCMHGMNNV